MERSKAIDGICREYITIDDEGILVFNSTLKRELENKRISRYDAIYIVLDLLYDVNNSDLNYTDIPKKLLELVDDVQKYDVNLRYERLFFKPYLPEIYIVIDYISKLAEEKNIKISMNVEEYDSITNTYDKSRKKVIKKMLNRFSRDELFYILDLDSNVNFEKDKVLKNKIATYLSEISFDVNMLETSTPDDIKKLLHSNMFQSANNEDIIRLRNSDLFNLVNEFKNREKSFESKNIKKLNKKETTEINVLHRNEKIIKNEEKDVNPQEKKNSNVLEENRRIIKKDNFSLSKKEKLRKKQRERIKQFKKAKNIGIYNKNLKEINDKKDKEKKLELDELKKIHQKKEEEKRIELERFRKKRNKWEEEQRQRKREEQRIAIKKSKKIEFTISKVRTFNNKSFNEMIQLRNECATLHSEISNDYPALYHNEDVIEFRYYFSNFNKIEELAPIEKYLNENKKLISEFLIELHNSGFLSSEKRKRIINRYCDFYKEASKINDYSEILINKIFFEFKNLEEFLKIFNDLDHYTNLSNTPDNNKIRKINQNALDKKINENKYFFKDITDINKKRAIVIDEKNVKVIAGAGTGKTFTIQNKVRYLIEHQNISPEKILCLCYTGKGAADLKDKVNEFSDDNYEIKACTFHGFCREIIKNYYNIEISTYENLLEELVINYIRNTVADDEKLEKLINYFCYYNTPPTDEDEFTSYDELVAYEKGHGLKQLKEKFYDVGVTMQSLQGKIVNSIGELMIANYLFMHDIEYEYELEYQHNFSKMIKHRFIDSGHYFSMRNISKSKEAVVKEYIKLGEGWEGYHPDFYFPDKQLYLEHFGIRGKDDEKWLGKDYLNQMVRKREYHKKNGSKLIETYYSYLVDEILLDELEKLLKGNDIKIGQKDRKDVLDIIINTNKVEDFKNFKELILSFINIFEANNLPKKKFKKFKNKIQSAKDSYEKKRQELFFDIVSDIYEKYFKENEPKDIDYNRQVSLALELIKTKKFRKTYEYILVDEYQDINPIRCQFLQELQKNTGAKMLVVGDDWQSIYGFNGSDLKLFIDFDNYFPNSELIKLEENRRNCQNLNNIACKFIRKNNIQEKKNLKSFKDIEDIKYPIKIIRYNNNEFKKDNLLKLFAIIMSIITHNPKKENAEILLLGRSNNDINEYIDNILFEFDRYDSSKIICNEKPNLNIRFMTIHKSKGLEFDAVVILNLEDKINGFPNKIKDDPLLRFVKNNHECKFAEERRLLYVALTRTKNYVFLLAPKKDESIFIRELMKLKAKNYQNLSNDKNIMRNYYFPKRKVVGDFELWESNIKCPNCDDGNIIIVRDKLHKTMYIRCSTDPAPDSNHYNGGPYWGNLRDVRYIEKCPSCNGVLIKGHFKDHLVCSNNLKGCKEEKKLF